MSRKKFLFISAQQNTPDPGAGNDLNLGEENIYLRDLFPYNHKHIECIRETYVSYNNLKDLFEVHRKKDIEILHFSGHSGKNGLLLRNAGDDNAGKISIQEFKSFLSWYPNLKVLILNSCSSKYIAKELEDIEHLEVIVETTETIYDRDAIIFTKLFYDYLDTKDDFRTALEKTRDKFLRMDFAEKYDRGKVRDLSGETEMDEDFPWRLNPKNSDYKFVYPNIADKIRASFSLNPESNKQLIFAYAENPNVSESFQKAFVNSGYTQHCDLYMLDDEDLSTLAESTSQDIFSEDIKVIFIAYSGTTLFDNPLLKNVFDDEKKFKVFKNLKFSLAVKNGIDLNKAIENTDYFKSKIEDFPKFNFDGFDNLCVNVNFDKFINEISVDLSIRKSRLMKFPCNPTRSETSNIDKSKFIKIFFATRKNENLINFIINGIITYHKYTTPTIISDALNMEGKSLKDALKTAFLKTYKSDSNEGYKFSKILDKIIENSHIIVFRTNIVNVEKMKTEFRLLLEELDTMQPIWDYLGTAPEKPTLIFFLNSEFHQINEQPVKAAAETKTLSQPLQISNAELKEWTNLLRNEDFAFDLVLDELEAYDLSVFADDCPSKVIELVCDKIKVGKQKVLSLS